LAGEVFAFEAGALGVPALGAFAAEPAEAALGVPAFESDFLSPHPKARAASTIE
jgi:hypothetical protein